LRPLKATERLRSLRSSSTSLIKVRTMRFLSRPLVVGAVHTALRSSASVVKVRCQAEIPLIALCKIPEPLLTPKIPDQGYFFFPEILGVHVNSQLAVRDHSIDELRATTVA
jgi:hypothetical protein